MAQYLDRAGLRVVLQHIKSNYAKSADLTKANEKLSSLGISDISGLSDALTAAKLSVKVVDTLPATGERGVLYLVGATNPDADGKNVYVEYVWIEDGKKFEKLGDTAVDLSDYVKSEQLNALSSKVDGKVDKEEGKGLSANDYTTAEKTKLGGIAEKATADEAIPVGTSADTTTEDAYALDRTNNILVNFCNRTAQYRGGNNVADNDAKWNTLLGKPVVNVAENTLQRYAEKNGDRWGATMFPVTFVIGLLCRIIFHNRNIQAGYNAALTADGLGISSFS